MPIVSTMIINSLTMLGDKQIGTSSLTTEEGLYYQSRWNSFIDMWTNERLTIPFLSVTSFPLTVSTGTYSIGNGATFNMPRPTAIVDPCFIRDSSQFDTEIAIIDAQAYGRFVQKSSSGSYPSYLFYDHGFSATSTATVYLWPLPIAGLTLFINTYQPLTVASTLTHSVNFPPGYQTAIESNFALYAKPISAGITQALKDLARTSKAAIKTTNLSAPISRLDYGVVTPGRYNILTGP